MNIENYLSTNKERFLNELIDFLKIPSVGTLSKYNQDTLKAAEFLGAKLKEAGADKIEIIKTKKHPLVYGEKIVDKNLPTILVYGHYDVQPPDPYELWDSPPFSPAIRNNKIYARGSSDDKGQVFIHVKAFETLVQTNSLPCNIKFIFEGEEEDKSESLSQFLDKKENLEKIKSDAIIISDTELISNDIPSIPISLRGVISFDIEVSGPKIDLHSGVYGGAIANPIIELSKIIASLKDKNNKIIIPKFYDDVIQHSKNERETLNKIPFNLNEYKKEVGVNEVSGEEGYTTVEQTGIRPSLDVNGIWGGFTNPEGFKTVLPSKANAKISIRLVPNQDHNKIIEELKKYIISLTPKGIKLNLNIHEGSTNGFLINSNSKVCKAASLALEQVWGKSPVLTRGGGSIPIITKLKESLKVDLAMLGFGLPSDAIHSPNESFGLTNFFKGIETIIAFYNNFTKI